ncbi:MAG: response regulator transcription factor [Ruminococcus sp.]|nr:response regulator transcription factor [Ruminococcus sp.]
MFTILIIEDDNALRSGLEFDLAAEGYNVVTAENGRTALERLDSADIALMDVNLPDTEGFELCREIKNKKNIPVIFLTCRDLEADELNGFNSGADDYITKPFSLPVLRKRISAVLKRNEVLGDVYSDGFLTVDFTKLTASAGGKNISFTPTEYKLLNIFIKSKGSVLTRQILLEKLWDGKGNFVDEHTLTVNINRIRGKIEDDDHKYIKTVYGIGYVWNGENQ